MGLGIYAAKRVSARIVKEKMAVSFCFYFQSSGEMPVMAVLAIGHRGFCGGLNSRQIQAKITSVCETWKQEYGVVARS